MCPSGAAFAIPLGPTNPWLITIAKETLIFRRLGLSPRLRLLVPTFLLPHAPRWLTPSASTQSGILSYRPSTRWCIPHLARGKLPLIKENLSWVRYAISNRRTLSFGNILSPDYLRRKISRWVSCYAFFKWWLLLSRHPHCLRNFTSLRCT